MPTGTMLPLSSSLETVRERKLSEPVNACTFSSASVRGLALAVYATKDAITGGRFIEARSHFYWAQSCLIQARGLQRPVRNSVQQALNAARGAMELSDFFAAQSHLASVLIWLAVPTRQLRERLDRIYASTVYCSHSTLQPQSTVNNRRVQ